VPFSRRLRVLAVAVVVAALAVAFLVARLSGLQNGSQPVRTPTPTPAPSTSPTPSASPSPTPRPSPRPGLFGIGTLNWRGASHYLKDPHPAERPYTVRIPFMIAKIERSGISIAGFQEFEARQARAFLRATGHRWALARGSSETGAPDTRDAIAYRTDLWRLDRIRTLSIVYAGGHRVRIPLARFTARPGSPARGHSIWVLNTHNPASVRFIGGTAISRAYDVAVEAAALRRLARDQPHTGVLFTGDMNSKAAFRDLFLRLAGPGWKSADPLRAARVIDWIMGGPGVRFSGTTIDWSTKDGARRYTDHPFVHTDVVSLP
jgi:hypothetical protein